MPATQRSRRTLAVALASMLLATVAAFVTAANASTHNGAELQIVSLADGPAGQESTTAYAGTTDASGNQVVFVSNSLDGKPAGIYLRDLRHARTRFLAEGGFPDLDASGTRLTFTRDGQLYALDLRSGARRLLSPRHHDVVEKRRTGSSGPGSISGNGRYVTFSSTATDLLGQREAKHIAGVLGRGQIYVRDLTTGKIEIVSRASGEGAIGDGESREPVISANGRYVAFTSTAGNLIPGAPDHRPAIYLRDLQTGATRLVSHFARSGQHRTTASQPSLSADGRYVCFELNKVGRPPIIVVRDLRRHSRAPITSRQSSTSRICQATAPGWSGGSARRETRASTSPPRVDSSSSTPTSRKSRAADRPNPSPNRARCTACAIPYSHDRSASISPPAAARLTRLKSSSF